VRSLEIRIKLLGRIIPCGMLPFLISAASKNFITVDLSYLYWSIVTFNPLY
jgi:hypothetical protein